MSAVRVCATDACQPEPVVPTGQKPLANVANPLEAEQPVLGSVLLIVDVAELVQMPVEDRVQLIATPGDVASLGVSRGRTGCGLHTL